MPPNHIRSRKSRKKKPQYSFPHKIPIYRTSPSPCQSPCIPVHSNLPRPHCPHPTQLHHNPPSRHGSSSTRTTLRNHPSSPCLVPHFPPRQHHRFFPLFFGKGGWGGVDGYVRGPKEMCTGDGKGKSRAYDYARIAPRTSTRPN